MYSTVVTLVTLFSLAMFYFTCIVVTTCFHVSLVWTRNNKTSTKSIKKIDDDKYSYIGHIHIFTPLNTVDHTNRAILQGINSINKVNI